MAYPTPSSILPLRIQYEPVQDAHYARQSRPSRRKSPVATWLHVAIGLLMVDSGLEMALLSNMVYWLNQQTGFFFVDYNGSSFSLHGKPANLLVNQGHTTNGAAGTAFVAIGLGGILALSVRAHAAGKGRVHGFASFLYNFWLVMTVLEVLFCISALVATFVLTAQHVGQTIDISVASKLHNEPFPNFVAYPLLTWTPENWFTAVLQLPLHSASDRSIIQTHLTLMKAWRWNLIPLTVFSAVVSVLAFIDRSTKRHEDVEVQREYEVKAWPAT